MSNGLLLTAIAAVLMFGGAVLLLLIERRTQRSLSIAQRLDEAPGSVKAVRGGQQWAVFDAAYRILQRAGFVHHPRHLLLVAASVVVICGGAYWVNGFAALLMALGLMCIGVYVLILWRAAATHKKMLQQLPGFIDQIIRTMGIGRSFESALLQAIDDSPPPLSEALDIVRRENALGGSVMEALHDTAQIYRLRELHLLTLALRINQRYGGSIKAMLENIIGLIRQREQAERELRALTGETRLSAWLLGTMPLAMAGYMALVNPTYIGNLLDDPNGTGIIATALGLQIAGGLLIWRMMRSLQ